MVCHIFSDIVRVPQFERPNPDAETPEEIADGQEFLDNPNRADEDGAPEPMDQRPDTDLLTGSTFYGKIKFAITKLKYMK